MEGSEKVAADIDRVGNSRGCRMQTNDEVPERGHHHNLRPSFCITEHGWIGAGGGPVGISFVWFAGLLSHICFAAFVDAYFLSI